MRVARAKVRSHVRAMGALLAVAIVGAFLTSTALWRPLDIDPGWAGDQPEAIAFVLTLTAIIGWWAGRVAASGGFFEAGAVGAGAGVAWVLLGVVVAVIGAFVDSLARGSASALDIGPTAVWGLYGLMIVTVIGSVLTVPVGLLWGLVTRLVAGPAPAADETASRPTRHPGRQALAALTILALTTGLFQATASGPPGGARCLDIGGERPLDVAFSPDGTWLAAVAASDPNRPGIVRLMRWPSGETVATWRAWIDHDVAIDTDGHVYWSAFELEEPWQGGILTASAGSEPEWLTTDEEASLWSLTWTEGALRGMTGNSHRVASLPLDGHVDPSLAFGPGTDPVGTFWASPDGRTTATSAEWSATHVAVTRPDGSVVQVPIVGEPRSIALTPDHEALVVASWSDGTRLVDLDRQSSERLLRGSQSSIAVSRQGDLAWIDEEQVGPGQVCIAPLLADHRAATSEAPP